jgi:hypothetical protein
MGFFFGKFGKGERPGSAASNDRRSQGAKESAIQEKKSSGSWLSKSAYEHKTGKPGRK